MNVTLKRNCSMTLRFTKQELDALTKKARKTKYSRESYCRNILNGAKVYALDVDVPRLIQEVKRVGNLLNQIAKVANSQDLVDVPLLRKALADLEDVKDLITRSYTTETN